MLKEKLDFLKKKLPACPGINGRDEYINTAVLILLMKIEGELHFIFQKRSEQVRHGGEICFPGGMFDPAMDRNFRDTALRETTEELGIPGNKIEIIGCVDTVVASMGATIDGFVGLAKTKNLEELSINHKEVEKVFTVPVSYFENNKPEIYKARLMVHPSYTDKDGKEIILFPARELNLPEYYSKPWGNAVQAIYLYRWQDEIIWGITARFIYDLVKKNCGA